MNETARYFLSSRWLTRYNNHISLYDREFDLFKRQEIISEIRSQLYSLSFVTDILIIVPSHDSVISANGWFINGEAAAYYSEDGLLSSLNSPIGNNNLLPLTYRSIMSNVSECSVCMLVDRKKMLQFAASTSLEQFERITIEYNGMVLEETEADSADAFVQLDSPLFPMQFRLRFQYQSFQALNRMGPPSLHYFFAGLGALFLCVLVAAFLSYITTKPINLMLQKLSESKRNVEMTAYRRLPDCVDQIIHSNVYLSKQLEQYRKTVRNDVLFRLLTDEAAAAREDDLLQELIPWAHEGLGYQILLLFKRRELAVSEGLSALIATQAVHFHPVQLPNCDRAFLIWYAPQKGSSLPDAVRTRLSSQYFIAFSDLEYDFRAVSRMYALARERLDEQLHLEYGSHGRISFSLSAEIQLINAIENNRTTECEKIVLHTLHKEGREQLVTIMQLLVRMADEHSIDRQEFVERYNQSLTGREEQKTLEILLEFCGYLCDAVEKIRAQSTSDVAVLIQKYVQDNYFDCNMSLKLLSEVFHLNISLISRMYKSELHVNFSDSLLEIRMAHAKELLLHTDLPLVELSQRVGYQNYLSFKRAFIRKYELSPREYREKYAEGMELLSKPSS